MKKIFFLLCLVSLSSILLVNTVFAQPVSQTFNSSGTYTVPAGYSAIVTIEAWGAGGGGGSGAAERGGGGGGAYSTVSTTLTAGSYAVTVGTGGTAGNAGGNSSFTTIVIAGGGSSTTSPTGGARGTVITGTGFGGGIGGNAGNNNSGGGGGGGSATSTAVGGNGGTGKNGNNMPGGVGGTGQGAGGAGAANSNGAAAVAGTAPGGGGGGRSSNGTSTSSGGANGRVVVTVNTVLPVRISSIRAYEKQNGVQIDWTVNAEENLSKYKVERSANGNTFIPLGDVIARNSSAASNYGFFDADPLPGVSFYRLRSVDLDGKYGLSSIVRINLDKNGKDIKVYPNPVANSFVSIQSAGLTKGNYIVKIFTTAGQLVKSQKFMHTGGSVNQTIQLPAGTNSGMYTMQLNNDGVNVMRRLFMVLQ